MHTHLTTDQLLKSVGLRTTEQRLQVLQVLSDAGMALSHGELEKRLGQQLDRVTLYRTLRTFVEKDLIHQVPDKKDGVRYALCGTTCLTHHSEGHNHAHGHNHLHFTCRSCEGTFCLENITIPNLQLPKGYLSEEASLVIQGLCNKCSAVTLNA